MKLGMAVVISCFCWSVVGSQGGEKTHYVMQIRAQLRIRRYAVRPGTPINGIARANDRRAQQIAAPIRFRPILLEGEVQVPGSAARSDCDSVFWLV